jgi:nitroimidazol reductase NimA-like FMN-containing flavoprotein (pyridoxamine 5'-phosphate oxidase superfamily)
MLQATDLDDDSYLPTYKTKAHRYADCISYKRTAVREILKEGYVCHVGFVYDDFKNPPYPVALPTLYALDTSANPTNPEHSERLYLHGSSKARLYATAIKNPAEGVPVCLTVSLVDSMVLAERAFWHAVYYRSVMAYGNAIPVTDEGDKMAALEVVVEHMFKQRWQDTEPPSKTEPPDNPEFEHVGVLRLELTEASAKIQEGDTATGKCGLKYEEDQDPVHWGGVIRVSQAYGDPQPNEATKKSGIPIPEYLKGYHRPQT